jgi:hypothetical protein
MARAVLSGLLLQRHSAVHRSVEQLGRLEGDHGFDGVHYCRRHRDRFVAAEQAGVLSIAFFFATLAPTSNLIIPIGTIMAERFLYLPSVGFAACVVFVLRAVCARLPALQFAYRYGTLAAVGIILIALGFRRTIGIATGWMSKHSEGA